MENNKEKSVSKIFATSFVSGGIAGVIAKTAIAPVDRLKIIFLVSNERFTYRSMYNKAKDLYKRKGFVTFWRGNMSNTIRVFPLGATQFGVYDILNNKFSNKNDNSSLKKSKHFIFGAIGGVCAAFVTYPLEFQRVRMAMVNKLSKYNMTEMIVKTIKHEGFSAFYRGIGPALAGVVVYKGNGFMFFEYVKPIVNEYTNSFSQSQIINNFVSGAIAGLCAQVVSYPFDVIKKKYQSMGSFVEKDFVEGRNKTLVFKDMLKKIYKEEGFFRGFYKGISMNVFKGPISVGISFTTKFYVESQQNNTDH